MKSTKHHDSHVGSLHQKLRIHQHVLELAPDHIKRGHDILSLGLSLVQLCLRKYACYEFLALLRKLLLHLEFLVDLLLLDACF